MRKRKLVTYVPKVIEEPLLWGQCDPEPLSVPDRILPVLGYLGCGLVFFLFVLWFDVGSASGAIGAMIGAAFTLLITGYSKDRNPKFSRGLRFTVTNDIVYFNKRPPVELRTVTKLKAERDRIWLSRRRFGLGPVELLGVQEPERVAKLLKSLIS